MAGEKQSGVEARYTEDLPPGEVRPNIDERRAGEMPPQEVHFGVDARPALPAGQIWLHNAPALVAKQASVIDEAKKDPLAWILEGILACRLKVFLATKLGHTPADPRANQQGLTLEQVSEALAGRVIAYPFGNNALTAWLALDKAELLRRAEGLPVRDSESYVTYREIDAFLGPDRLKALLADLQAGKRRAVAVGISPIAAGIRVRRDHRTIEAGEWRELARRGLNRDLLNLRSLVTRGRGIFSLSHRTYGVHAEFENGTSERFSVASNNALDPNYAFLKRWEGSWEVLVEISDAELPSLREGAAAGRVKSIASVETECRQWLSNLVARESRAPGRDKVLAMALRQFPEGLSKRGFIKCWDAVVPLEWKKAGAKPKHAPSVSPG